MQAFYLAAFLSSPAFGQTYNSGIGKTTHAISNATAALEWFLARIPSTGPAAFGHSCTKDIYCACGQVGRVSIQTDSLQTTGFGLHTVHTNGSSPRPEGSVTIANLEANMTSKFQAAVSAGGYDAFLDYSTGFWVSDLDPYVEVFSDLPTLAMEWMDTNNGQTYYSLMVQVSNSYLVLELMSATQTQLPVIKYQAPHPRFLFEQGESPETVFGDLSGTSTGGLPLFHAARVGQYTSSVSRDKSYYADVIGANVLTTLQSGDVETLILDFSNIGKSPNYVQVHLVQRPSTNTSGAFTIADAEDALNAEHGAELVSDVCGWDQFMDYHFAVNTAKGGGLTFGKVVPKIEKAGYKYHVLSGASGDYTLYAITPNGLSIQMTGMKSGSYTPSDTPTAVDGLCGVGPASCSKASSDMHV